ncbi:MAG: hypothetical protein AAFV33_03175 [Chloroflexota bacterium]
MVALRQERETEADEILNALDRLRDLQAQNQYIAPELADRQLRLVEDRLRKYGKVRKDLKRLNEQFEQIKAAAKRNRGKLT